MSSHRSHRAPSSVAHAVRRALPFVPIVVIMVAAGVGLGLLAVAMPSLSWVVVTLLGGPLLVVIAWDIADTWRRDRAIERAIERVELDAADEVDAAWRDSALPGPDDTLEEDPR